ncbi:MAG: hypothetical protein KF866_06845 [Phycisphaeraceae bacterium]|nr:hypothetical protein [Phycisphaeraceae bacterium]MCW5755429.1 hypothetical protein [Phycisphaeraceae bacterium]
MKSTGSGGVRRVRAAGVLCLGVAVVGGALAFGQGQPSSHPEFLRRRANQAPFEAWVPPGTYTAIVISSSGEQRQWPVALVTKGSRSAIMVRPGQQVVIPFEGGWTIDKDDLVRIESDRVPFFDYSLLDPLDGSDIFVLHAWGITPNGPVSFTVLPGVPDWVAKRARVPSK